MGKIASIFIALLLFWTWSWYPNYAMDIVYPKPKEPVYTYESLPMGGPDYPAYWVTEDYWVAEGCPVDRSVKERAEGFLALLDAHNIAQTAIICMPDEGFTIPPGTWADRFATYLGLGLDSGDRRNNGMLWLIRYSDNNIEVNYTVGDGLAALTAPELGAIQVAANEATSVAEAIDIISVEFSKAARQNYEPYQPAVEVKYGGPIEKQASDAESILALFLLGLGLYLAVQPFISLSVVIGVVGFATSLIWPLRVLLFFLEVAASSSSGGSSGGGFSSSSGGRSSGKILGGSRGFHRNN